MNKIIYLTLLLNLIGYSALASAQQVCRSASEIPASTPTARFTDHGNGTVTDKQTGLMWAKCPFGAVSDNCEASAIADWSSALDVARTSTLAGYENWRLPNIKELLSIVEFQCFNPAINLAMFLNTPGNSFWSASPNADASYSASHVSFDIGHSSWTSRSNNFRVRLVRSGQ